jgi:4-hydroxy-tetrahydrodipicolinate reductase
MGTWVREAIAADPALSLGAAVVSDASPRRGEDAGGVPFVGVGEVRCEGLDVVVDFSTPAALEQGLDRLVGVPLVTGTTGLSTSLQARLDRHAEQAPLLQAANFSTGVNVLLDLVRRAVAALPEADVEIVEVHHRRKVDSPSGTALALGAAATQGRPGLGARHGRQGAAGPRERGELGYHAVRGGDVAGDHTVWLLADGERVALQHIASSRQTFALGALRAARWLVDRPPGAYGMADVLGLGAS